MTSALCPLSLGVRELPTPHTDTTRDPQYPLPPTSHTHLCQPCFCHRPSPPVPGCYPFTTPHTPCYPRNRSHSVWNSSIGQEAPSALAESGQRAGSGCRVTVRWPGLAGGPETAVGSLLMALWGIWEPVWRVGPPPMRPLEAGFSMMPSTGQWKRGPGCLMFPWRGPKVGKEEGGQGTGEGKRRE